MWLWPLSAAAQPKDPAIESGAGPKAMALARLAAAGLPVPAAMLIPHSVFERCFGAPDLSPHGAAALAEKITVTALPLALRQALLDLPWDQLMVRSSMSLEDGDRAAPGIFTSRAASRSDAAAALCAVWASALMPGVIAYARQHAHPPLRLGVIVQELVPGPRITVYTRVPGQPQSDLGVTTVNGVTQTWSRADASNATVQLALAAERALDLPTGADVELVGSPPWVVQARALVHPATPVRSRPPAGLMQLDSAHVWHWDRTHNPAPVSPAQEWLVRRLSPHLRRSKIAVAARYLYWCDTSHAADDTKAATASGGEPLAVRAREMQAWVDANLPRQVLSLDDAVTRAICFCQRWEQWSAALSNEPKTVAHATMVPLMAKHAPSHDVLTLDLADLSWVWDIAYPTLGERSNFAAWVAAAIASPALDSPLQAAEWRELDDVWFYRMHAMVRRALVARGEQAGISSDLVGWLWPEDPLPSRERAVALAGAAQRCAERAMAWAPWPSWPAGPERAGGEEVIAAWGAATVVAPTYRWNGDLVPAGHILVADAITPGMALAAHAAVGLIAAHGHHTDHGAALARELGIPYVFGVSITKLTSGQRVTLDPVAGTVT